jgi:GTP 3',8-cyclase
MDNLIDRFGRRVTYLRMSVTDRCDFRCVYCMDDTMAFVPRAQLLTLEEMATVARAFTELGGRQDPDYRRRATGTPQYHSVIP